MAKVVLLVRSFNRPDYLKDTLCSLLESDIDICTHRYIYDDGSTDTKVHEILDADSEYTNVLGKEFIVLNCERNVGCKSSYTNALERITDECDFVCTVDNDVNVTKDWIKTFLSVFTDAYSIFQTRNMLLTGFKPTNAHPHVIHKYPTFHTKSTCGGVSYFFHNEFKSYIKEKWGKGHLDWGVCNAIMKDKFPFVCVNKSIVQHIGKQGLYSSKYRWDQDVHFKN